jgi:YggT family protein
MLGFHGYSSPVATAIEMVFVVLQLAILGRILLSWVDPSPFPDNGLKRVLWALTEPILDPLRRVIPPLGMFDMTPMVAIIVLIVLQQLLLSLFGG